MSRGKRRREGRNRRCSHQGEEIWESYRIKTGRREEKNKCEGKECMEVKDAKGRVRD
jgi:hypothetical protein